VASQRFDLHVRALDGPTAGQVMRGKGTGGVVDIGKEPPPGGIRLPVRSLAPVHARVQLSQGQAVVVPLGTHPVRVAPHGNVDWSRVDPLREAAWWNPGGVVYLGRLGSGVRLELVQVEALGAWEGGATTSATSPTSPVRIKPSRLPLALVGCGVVGVGVVLALALGVLLYALRPQVEVVPLDGKEIVYDFAEVEESSLVKSRAARKDLEAAWETLVVRPSADQADAHGRTDLEDRLKRKHWDEVAFRRFVASAEKHGSSLAFYRRVHEVRELYAQVLTQVEQADLPQALAAIPLTESQYDPNATSSVCAKGFWQLMPETAIGAGAQVVDCALSKPTGETVTWSPSGRTPPRNAVYIDRSSGEPTCSLGRCRIDDRTRLEPSTAASLRTLSKAWNDADLATSGSAVVLTILSHNAGYFDRPLGVPRPTNIRPAYNRWRRGVPEQDWHRFYGQNLLCEGGHAELSDTCGGQLVAQSQHYAYTVLAQHLVAMCYLGRNYPDDPAFIGWADRARRDEGPCSRFRVPDKSAFR